MDATITEGYERMLKSTRQKITPCLEVRNPGVSMSSGFDEFLYASAIDHTLSYDRFMAMKQEKNEKHQRTL